MAAFPYQKFDSFFSKQKTLTYKKRQMILHTDDTPSGIYYIQEGYVRQFLISQEGKEFTTIIYKPKDLFPIRWAINNNPIHSYYESITYVKLQRAPREQFIEFITREPDAFLQLTSRIINRLDVVLERMEYLAFGTAYQKIASIILLLTTRFGKKAASPRKPPETVIEIPFTHQDIASLIGIARETVSTQLNQLEKKAIIAHQGHLISVLSIERLRKESLLIS